MKNSIYFIFFVVTSFIFSSCEETGLFGYDPTNTPRLISGFKATIDGEDLSTKNVSYSIDGTAIVITAIQAGTNEVFTFKVSNYKLGIFDFQGTDNVATYVNNSLSPINTWTTNSATSSKGSIEFTNIDAESNSISGTFTFTGDDLDGNSKTFTGSFTEIIKTELPPSSNLFTAAIDNVAFTGVTVFGKVDNKNTLQITASDALNENTIILYLPADITTGNLVFRRNTNPKAEYIVNDVTYFVKDNKGRVEITTHDIDKKIISGTFFFLAEPSFSLSPTFIVNNTNFSVSY
ncbi:DUF6252 family protein [uncultured Polaribacter sp.]|uniref:DUF6252 family protein n=1 Tax=uncultured Polaribacter sp. TaxID=174711 RepID=UPI00261F44E1|nr:DUF6252 family protein [uncultured Polaribacter sp.]